MAKQVKTVYAHLSGCKTRFNFRYDPKASVAGHWELREHDEIWEWHWFPCSNFGSQPSGKWLYWNRPCQ